MATRPDTAPFVRLSNGETAPMGVWLTASIHFARIVPDDQPYPCVCSAPGGCERRRENLDRCPCWGRIDNLKHLPGRCCAVRRAAVDRLSRKDNDSGSTRKADHPL